MASENQSRCSTSWKPGGRDRTRAQAIQRQQESDDRRPQRDPARVVAASPRPRRAAAGESAPTSGRIRDAERMPKAEHQRDSPEQKPGDERRDADQHGEGVVIDVAGLQPHDVARHVDDARRDAVRPEAVDDAAVAALPEQPAEPEGRAHEDEVVELVEIPFVEQEAVEERVGARQRRAAPSGATIYM